MKRLVLTAAITAVAAASGCQGPPPALPTKVLEQGAEGLPEEHPELTEQQLTQCALCHRASDAPGQ